MTTSLLHDGAASKNAGCRTSHNLLNLGAGVVSFSLFVVNSSLLLAYHVKSEVHAHRLESTDHEGNIFITEIKILLERSMRNPTLTDYVFVTALAFTALELTSFVALHLGSKCYSRNENKTNVALHRNITIANVSSNFLTRNSFIFGFLKNMIRKNGSMLTMFRYEGSI